MHYDKSDSSLSTAEIVFDLRSDALKLKVRAFKEYLFVQQQPHKLSVYSGQSLQESAESVKDSMSKSSIKRPGSKRHSKF